jgi:hypothetical protein
VGDDGVDCRMQCCVEKPRNRVRVVFCQLDFGAFRMNAMREGKIGNLRR